MGVRITTSRGKLALRICWKGRRDFVGLDADDDGQGGEMRAAAQLQAYKIARALRSGVPLHEALITVLGDAPARFVPDSARTMSTRPSRAAQGITLREHAKWWVERVTATERKSYWRKARSYTNHVILPFFGDVPLAGIDTAKLLAFQEHVLARTKTKRDTETGEVVVVPIKTKTAKNIVTTYLRSMLVSAMARHRVPSPDPFPAELLWPKAKGAELLEAHEPDPFTASERDRIFDWYLKNARFWYPLVYFMAWVGARPSEIAALREVDVDLERGTVRINKSRDEGEDGPTKTKASKRTITLYPNVLEVLRTVRPAPMHPEPDAYFFTDPDGEPLWMRDWAQDYGFYDVLARLKIRARGIYSFRDTSISWQLTQGANIWGVAKYHGTGLAPIESSYGKWIPEGGLDQAVLKAVEAGRRRGRRAGEGPSENASTTASDEQFSKYNQAKLGC